MKPKAWQWDEFDLGPGVPSKSPLLGRPTLCTIALSPPAVGAPPSPLPPILLHPAPAPGPQAPYRLLNLPPDRFLRPAPQQLDEGAIVAASSEIDQRILLNPYAEYDLRMAETHPPLNAGSPRIGRNPRRGGRPMRVVPPSSLKPVPPPPAPLPPRSF